MFRHVAREHHRSVPTKQSHIDYKNDPDYARKLQRCLICWKWHKCNADHQNCMKRHRQCLSDLNMDVECPKCHQVGVNLNLILFQAFFSPILRQQAQQNFRNLEFRSKILKFRSKTLEFSRKSLSLEEFFKGFMVKNGKFSTKLPDF